MAQGQRTNQVLVREARAGLDQFKWEVAKELGMNVREGDYLGDFPARECGAIGGHMVRKMIQSYEQSLARGR